MACETRLHHSYELCGQKARGVSPGARTLCCFNRDRRASGGHIDGIYARRRKVAAPTVAACDAPPSVTTMSAMQDGLGRAQSVVLPGDISALRAEAEGMPRFDRPCRLFSLDERIRRVSTSLCVCASVAVKGRGE